MGRGGGKSSLAARGVDWWPGGRPTKRPTMPHARARRMLPIPLHTHALEALLFPLRPTAPLSRRRASTERAVTYPEAGRKKQAGFSAVLVSLPSPQPDLLNLRSPSNVNDLAQRPAGRQSCDRAPLVDYSLTLHCKLPGRYTDCVADIAHRVQVSTQQPAMSCKGRLRDAPHSPSSFYTHLVATRSDWCEPPKFKASRSLSHSRLGTG